MDSNLSYFSLPFVDGQDLDFGKIRGQDCDYNDLHPTLPHGSLLGADDDVLAQFLSGDDPLEEPDLNGPTTLHCEICRKHFDNAKKYYGHLRVHSKDNLWKCDKCPDEKFSTKQQLMKHSLTHQPLERVWRCPQCEMSFEALWRLQQHLFAKHLDYRPHKCEVCPKTFHKLSDLDKHKDVHAAVKKHACTVCERKFTDKSNLKRHMLGHGDEKAYPCSGCGHRYKQIASLHSHSKKCSMVQKNPPEPKKSYRNNYCRVCGTTFKYKSSLLEHCVREHSNNPSLPPTEPPKEDKSNQLHVDTNRTVDKIVDDILSAEDDYMTMSTQNDLINYPEVNQDNLMQIELLKEMNQMHNMQVNDMYDDELLYNDIDIDSFQTMCNNIDYERNDLFDLNDARSIDHIMNGKSLDQDLMNAFVRGIDQVKDDIPKEYLNPPEINVKVNEFLNPPVSVNDCSTIFESDVDLEASTNLAANLNQLIGENNVQYISTEHDDTFIISLNSEIDAEQLTDMLNIGMESKPLTTENYPEQPEVVNKDLDSAKDVNEEEKPPEKVKPEKKVRNKTKYVCLKCKKVFNKKCNYISHRGTHDGAVKEFECEICLAQFSYKSSLNKHTRKEHTPSVKTMHTCFVCNKNYDTTYQLQKHKILNHKLIHPYQCDIKDCEKKCFSKWDLDIHKKSHSEEKPYACDVCSKTYKTSSHLARHVKKVDCTKRFDKPKLVLTTKPERLKMATNDRPIINLYVCDDLNTDKNAKTKKAQTDANQDVKPASNLLLLPLKFVKKKPKKLKNAKKMNSKSLLKATDNLNVERNETKKSKIIKDHRLRKVNNNKKEGTFSAEPLGLKNCSEMNLENEQHSEEIMKMHGINMMPMPSGESTNADEESFQKLLKIKKPVLAELPNSKIHINVENEQHSDNSNEIRKTEIVKDKTGQKVLKLKRAIISEPLKSKTKINVNGNADNLKMNETKKIEIIRDERFRKDPKMDRPITVLPIYPKIEMESKINVELVENSERKKTNVIEIIKDERIRINPKIGRPITVLPIYPKTDGKRNIEIVENSERNKTNKIEIIKDERLHKVPTMKKPILADLLNSKIEINMNSRVKQLEINENKKIHIIKDEILRIAGEKKGFTLIDNLNSKQEVKPQLANDINLTKPLKSKKEPNKLKTDKIQIKTLNGEFIIEPLHLQSEQNKLETTKIDETKSKAPKGSILIEPLSSQLNKTNLNTLNKEVIKLQAPKSGSLDIKALGPINENTTEHDDTLIKCPNFRMERIVPKSENVEQSKAKSLIQITDLKIKIITPISEENKVKTPNGNFVVTSNSNMMTKKGNRLKIASFLKQKIKILPVASQKS